MARLRSEFGSLRQAATPPRGSGGSTAGGLPRGPALKLFRGERDISGLVWPFTPTPGSSPPFSTDVGAGLHGVSPPLRPAPGWLARLRVRGRRLHVALFGLAFAAARLNLRLAAGRDSLAHSSIGTPSHPGRCSDCLRAHGFRRCFTPLSGCFSPFPRGTGSLSVAGECSALEGGPPCFARGFTCPALLWAGDPLPATFRVRGSHPVPPAFPGRSPRWLVCNSGRGMRPSVAPPNNTGAETPARLHARRFGLARFRSPLLPGSRLISLPRGT